MTTCTTNIISSDFYDNDTYNILFNNMTDDDKCYIEENKLNIKDVLFTRWNTIILSFMGTYYNEYASMPTESRNIWFQKYIDLPSHYMDDMPESLL